MTGSRKPAAFRVEPQPAASAGSPREGDNTSRPDRKPRALDTAVVMPAEIDIFDEPDTIAAEPPPATAPRRRSILGRLLIGSLGVLAALAIGLWTDALIRTLFERAEWRPMLEAGLLGWQLRASIEVSHDGQKTSRCTTPPKDLL